MNYFLKELKIVIRLTVVFMIPMIVSFLLWIVFGSFASVISFVVVIITMYRYKWYFLLWVERVNNIKFIYRDRYGKYHFRKHILYEDG